MLPATTVLVISYSGLLSGYAGLSTKPTNVVRYMRHKKWV